jgi:hypothetical protein
MLYLYPAEGHPEGPKDEIWFVLIGGMLFPINARPLGGRGVSWYKKVDQLLYPTLGHPDVLHPHDAPHFKIDKHHCLPHDGHPNGASDEPWYLFVDVKGEPSSP